MTDTETPPISIEDIEAGYPVPAPPPEPFPGDPDATWTYWTDADTAENGVPDEWVWERLRIERDRRLHGTDYRVNPDVPWVIEPWITYRDELRDLPANTTDPRKAVWPTEPDEVKR